MAGRASRVWIASLVTSAALLASAPAESHAQAFAFSIGSGGGYRHHHGGWSAAYGFGPNWGPGWGPGWYGPPPIIYAPPPIVQPIYVQPQTVAPLPPASPYASPPYSSSTSPANATLAANTAPSLGGSTTGDDRIVIRNVAGAQLPVSFLVDSQDVELAEGATRTFIGKTHRTIQYDRGGRYGSTQQDLTGGQYEFRITSTGWDLVRKPDMASSRTAVRANTLPDGAVR